MQTMFPITTESPITGLILAGGKARRLNGEDKGLIQLGDSPLIAHVITKLRTQTSTVIINANRNQASYAQFDCPVIADSLTDFAGPLAGFLAGLQNISTEWMVTVPCDNPDLPDNLVATLSSTANKNRCRLTVASSQSRLQPVYCLLHRSLADSLSDFLASNQHKVQDWIKAQEHCVAEFDETKIFKNINTPEQLAEAEKNHDSV